MRVRYEPGPSGFHGGEGHQIVQAVTLIGDLTVDQRTRLEGVIDKCPVHKTLSAGISIVDA